MRKPDSLRAALTAAVPSLMTNPAQLKIWLDNGRVQSLGRGGPAAMEYSYKLSLLLTDFAADEPHTLFGAIVAWLAVNQPDVLLRPLDPASAITFEIEVMSDTKVDILVTLNLNEVVREDAAGAIVTLPEPALDNGDLLAPGAILHP
jgi:hypothetical protein